MFSCSRSGKRIPLAVILICWQFLSCSPFALAQLFHRKTAGVSGAKSRDADATAGSGASAAANNASPSIANVSSNSDSDGNTDAARAGRRLLEEESRPKSQKSGGASEKAKTKGSDKKAEPASNVDRSAAPCLSWVRAGYPVRAVLLCVHGLGLNSGSWTKFGQAMSQQGIATYAIDVRGFGSWMRAKGHQNVDFKDCINDVMVTLGWLHKSNPNKPVFLMGESMGGAIVLHVAAESPDLMDGVISVCSSGDRFKQKRTDLKVALHMLMGPRRKFNIGEKIVDQASADNPELKREWEADALDRMKLSPLELIQFQHFMNENHEEASKITGTPVLMVQGRKDPLVKPEGTKELFEELNTSDKQIMMVENAEHLIFEDQQFSDLTLNQVAQWIVKHCPPLDPGVAAFEEAMARARASLESGKLPQSLSSLRAALKLFPADASAHYLMGVLQMRLHHPLIARQHLIRASRLGRGGQVSRDANRTLMTLPHNLVAPRRVYARGKKVPFVPVPQPTVLIFNASWCQPCQDMSNTMEQAKQRFGQRVRFQMVDVDDKANADLVEHYSIGPVPTTVFLNPNGDVASFQVGYGGMEAMVKGLQSVLPAAR